VTGVDTETTDPSEVKLGFADILERIRRLTPTITDRHEDIDSARRLPSDLVAALRDTGVFRAAMPLAWGGPELSSMEQILLIEELAQADGSVGWCAMIGMDSGIYSGYLRPDVAREMFPRLDMVTAGWIPPMGRAHEVDGGYRVEGHWRFGSGCTHADVLGAGCTVFRDGAPLLDEEGKPTWRVLMADPASFVIAASALRRHPAQDARGSPRRGTGGHRLRVRHRRPQDRPAGHQLAPFAARADGGR